MRTTKIFALATMLIMVFALAACGNGNNNSGGGNPPSSETPFTPDTSALPQNPTQGDGGSTPLPDGAFDFNAQGDSPSDEERRLIASIYYIAEQGGDVFIVFEKPQDIEWDKIELYRGTDENILFLVDTIANDGNEEWYRMYIDKGAAGQGYYYSVRGVLGDVGGILPRPKYTQSEHEWEVLWYHGEDGYVLRFLRYSFENPAPDGMVYSEWLSYHFRWFDHDGNEIDMEHFRRYSYFYYDDSRERGYYSQTHDEIRYWEHGFRGGSSDTNFLINFDDESFEWADIFVEEGSYNKYTIDSNIYTVY